LFAGLRAIRSIASIVVSGTAVMLHELPLQMPPGVATQLSCWHGVDAVSSACTQVARALASVLISAVGAVAPAGRVEEGAAPVARLTRFCTVSDALAAPSRLVDVLPKVRRRIHELRHRVGRGDRGDFVNRHRARRLVARSQNCYQPRPTIGPIARVAAVSRQIPDLVGGRARGHIDRVIAVGVGNRAADVVARIGAVTGGANLHKIHLGSDYRQDAAFQHSRD
jgi:hypothetical protein